MINESLIEETVRLELAVRAAISSGWLTDTGLEAAFVAVRAVYDALGAEVVKRAAEEAK